MSDDPGTEAEGAKQGAPPVVATISLSEQDIRAGLLEIGGGKWRVGIMLGVIMMVLAAVSGSHGSVFSPTFIAPLVFMVGLFAAFSFYVPSQNAKHQIAILKKAGDTNVTYRFDDEGLTIRSAGASASVAYRRLVKARLGKTTLLLFTTGQIAQIIPLRAFTPDELARVLAYLPPNQKGSDASLWKGALQWKRIVVLWLVLIVAFVAIWQFLNDGSQGKGAAPTHHAPHDD